jgi:hypothetical protein
MSRKAASHWRRRIGLLALSAILCASLSLPAMAELRVDPYDDADCACVVEMAEAMTATCLAAISGTCPNGAFTVKVHHEEMSSLMTHGTRWALALDQEGDAWAPRVWPPPGGSAARHMRFRTILRPLVALRPDDDPAEVARAWPVRHFRASRALEAQDRLLVAEMVQSNSPTVHALLIGVPTTARIDAVGGVDEALSPAFELLAMGIDLDCSARSDAVEACHWRHVYPLDGHLVGALSGFLLVGSSHLIRFARGPLSDEERGRFRRALLRYLEEPQRAHQDADQQPAVHRQLAYRALLVDLLGVRRFKVSVAVSNETELARVLGTLFEQIGQGIPEDSSNLEAVPEARATILSQLPARTAALEAALAAHGMRLDGDRIVLVEESEEDSEPEPDVGSSP